MNNDDAVWYKLKSSGREFRICTEGTDEVVWRFRYSIVDNTSTVADLERASNWKRAFSTVPAKADEPEDWRKGLSY